MAPHSSTYARIDAIPDLLGPGPWPTADLMALGWSRGSLSRAVASGLLVRERRGLYGWSGVHRRPSALVVGAGVPARQARTEGRARVLDSHAARLRSLARGLDERAVFSHSSAARLHGMWLPDPAELLMHATIPGQADREDGGLRVHGSPLPAESVATVAGVAVTDVARTAIDLARPADLPHALIAVDCAMRLLLPRSGRDLDLRLRRDAVPRADIEAARDRLLAAAESMTGWAGVRTARAAVAAADPASASPFESWSRGWMLAVGMPAPRLNRIVLGASGREFVGDFVWDDRRLIGEADGVAKYGTTAQEIRAALRAERDRQADLEAAGWRLVRWVPGDTGATIVGRLGRALYLDPGSRAGGGAS